MSYRRSLVLTLLVLSVAAAADAQIDRFKERYESNVGSQDFDPRDLSGYWMDIKLDHTLGTPPPPLTPAGVKAKEGRVVDRPEKIGNAPWYSCNPMGFPRLQLDDEPIEFIMLPDRVLQLFQWEHRIRMIWTDGRPVPSGENLENLGPAWYGHSVGRWDGNTLIVDTVGLEERAWLDNPGNPKSFHARIQETWKRIDSNTLELQMTLYDPEYYTAPWVGSRRTYKRITAQQMTFSGWTGLFAGVTEGICAPMNEVEGYNKGFRDPGFAPKSTP
jgi:hypothetical protein